MNLLLKILLPIILIFFIIICSIYYYNEQAEAQRQLSESRLQQAEAEAQRQLAYQQSSIELQLLQQAEAQIQLENSIYNKSLDDLKKLETTNANMKKVWDNQQIKIKEYENAIKIEFEIQEIDKINDSKKKSALESVQRSYTAFLHIQNSINKTFNDIFNESNINNKIIYSNKLTKLYDDAKKVYNTYSNVLSSYNRILDGEKLEAKKKLDEITAQNKLYEDEKKYAVLSSGQCLIDYKNNNWRNNNCITNGGQFESVDAHKFCLDISNLSLRDQAPIYDKNNVTLKHNASTSFVSDKWHLVNFHNFCVNTDGNVVATKKDGTIAWQTKTSDNPNAYLKINTDGTLVLYKSDKTILKKIWPVT